MIFLSGRLFKDWILRRSIRRDSSNHTNDEWKRVRRAVEEALPFYESISEVISLGMAGSLRRRAIRRLEDWRRDWVLDSGTGPGVSSRMMIEDGFQNVIGLDPSLILLSAAKIRLNQSFNPVLGVAENLPIRAGGIAGTITCYSLRDVRDPKMAMAEFVRVARKSGRLEIVDIGKPDESFLRGLVTIYVAMVMPVIASLFIRRRLRGNPFRMIIPTFHRLSTNSQLLRLAEQSFGSANSHSFMLGGLVIIEAEKAV